MKITIIQFSPSGNTAQVANALKHTLEEDRNTLVQIIDITGDKIFFGLPETIDYLKSKINAHDLLMIGGPVYAHHLQYHVQDLIRMLPRPDGNTWGPIAIPFVTYGGISSGIALEEASLLLRKSGRTVIGGIKICASHKMTRAFMDEEFNHRKPGDELDSVVRLVAEKLRVIANGANAADKTALMKYQSRIKKVIINTVLDEKTWHEKRYPRISIDRSSCTACGKCAAACPVTHLQKSKTGSIREDRNIACIHCLNCKVTCPQKAISLKGDLEKGRAFMNKMIAKKGNKEKPSSCFYY